MKQRKVALAKGRLADKAIALFEKAGYDVSGLVEDSRMLIFQNKELSFLMVKPTDVPVYVELAWRILASVARIRCWKAARISTR